MGENEGLGGDFGEKENLGFGYNEYNMVKLARQRRRVKKGRGGVSG